MKKNAFTLIELMIVIVIVMILMSIAVMNFRVLIERTNLQGANQTIADIIQEVRTKALTKTKCRSGENATQWIYQLDTSSRQISVSCVDINTPPDTNTEFIRGCENKAACDLSNDIKTIDLSSSTDDGASWTESKNGPLTITFFTDSYHAKIEGDGASLTNIKIESSKNNSAYSSCMDKHAAYPLTSKYGNECKLFDN